MITSIMKNVGMLLFRSIFIFIVLLVECPWKTLEYNHKTAGLKDTVLLPCCLNLSNDNAVNQAANWVMNNHTVGSYQEEKLKAGRGFEDRVQISTEDAKLGNFSLTISPVEYNDAGSYYCFWGNKVLSDVRLEVLVPTQVTTYTTHPVTLPCYFMVNKLEGDKDLNVRWEKDGHDVLHLLDGNITVDSGFKDRISVSKERARQGDLSLTLNTTRQSDQGVYRCFYGEKIGNPDEVTLSVKGQQDNVTISLGDPLHLPLYIMEKVKVLFESGEHQVIMCTVEGDSPNCTPDYEHRVSVQKKTLTLLQVKEHDRGVYKIIAVWSNDTISSVVVNVTSPQTPYISKGWIALAVLAAVVVLGVILYIKRKSICRRTGQRAPYPHISEPETQPMTSATVPYTENVYLDQTGTGSEALRMSIPDSSQMNEDVPKETQSPMCSEMGSRHPCDPQQDEVV